MTAWEQAALGAESRLGRRLRLRCLSCCHLLPGRCLDSGRHAVPAHGEHLPEASQCQYFWLISLLPFYWAVTF